MATVGLSKAYAAIYSASGNTVAYSGGMSMGGAISFSVAPDNAGANDLFYDNALGESSNIFTSGTVNITIDQLQPAVAAMIFGATNLDGKISYRKDDPRPYVGLGVVRKVIKNGVTAWRPTILTKVQFSLPETAADTQGESIEWQTVALSGRVMHDNSINGDWLVDGPDQLSESAAERVIKSYLSIT